MENMEKGSHHYTPSHLIYYHEQYGEFMLWYKKDYFYVLVFNKSISPVFPDVIKTLVEV